jgi:hypothetical protein
MPSLPAWRTLLRLLDDPHGAGFPPDQLRQLAGGRELLAGDLLTQLDAPYLSVAHGHHQEAVDYFVSADGRSIRFQCPETGRLVAAHAEHVIRYLPSIEKIATFLQGQLGIAATVGAWAPELHWLGDATFNERRCSVFLTPDFNLLADAILTLFPRRVVRTPAVVFTAVSRKTPFCWSGGWGLALPLDQCLHAATGADAVLDLPLIAAEIRRPHRDIARRLVEFDLSSHILRIQGVGEFPIAQGEAAAVVYRLAEAVWAGEELVALADLRKAAKADTTKKFKEMMGRTKNQDLFIINPVQGFYALRLVPHE